MGETAEVFLNGEPVATRIVAPYDFDLTGLARDGENRLTIDVTNTLVYRMHDGFSAYHAIAPSGLIGPSSENKIIRPRNARKTLPGA